MSIKNFKQHLRNVHGSLGNNSENKQMSDRLSEAHPQDVANYDKKMKEGDRSTTKPTTKAGQSLTPNSKSGKESLALEYFDVYFGDNLTEDTRDEDIMEAVYDLVNLCDAVCDAVGLDEGSKPPPNPYQMAKKQSPQAPKRPNEPLPRGYDPKADYRADRDKHMNTKFRSQADQDASWANRKNWGK